MNTLKHTQRGAASWPAAPSLGAVVTAAAWICAALVHAGDPPALRVSAEAPMLAIADGRQEVLQYAWDRVSHKPYVKSLLSPAGVNVLRDAPADHRHHHGAMFAVAADGVDFWSETPACGVQASHQPPVFRLEQGAAGPHGAITHLLDWKSADGKAILEEQRTIVIHSLEGAGPRLVTWRTRLAPAAGRRSARLTGSHYFGLGMRFAATMDNAAQFSFADDTPPGPVVRGDERLTAARWCAAAGRIDDRPVTIAVFDHPDNAPHKAHFFTMSRPFAYLSATTNLWKQPLELADGKALVLCYGIAVWDGQAARDDIDRAARRWLAAESK